ncbi:hypothetical protein OOZ19_23255 [Saccharopolyspora sp. NFXS83]|uniref:hypothetical protein n=1 Tax=Saccharopolyspora sp. NFXS83 TaxID=2993560 RepID=UPI00224A9881|nr:hypothetical protein [Saccharopolyspora sp. NFXS83]MCX2733170.1 hypothetical protein [Saccharopolyspora sp. NFXS83]
MTAALVVKVKLGGAAAQYGPPPGYPRGPGGPPFPQQQMPQPYPPQGPYRPR